MDRRILAVGILFFLILIAGYVFFVPNENPDPLLQEQTETDQLEQESRIPLGAATFEWRYEPFTEDEIPRSTINLVATYENGNTEEKVVDTIQGGCNVYPEPDTDVYSDSEMIICYYAGLGHYFKIIESDDAYLVQRKVFEEASPEYNPPTESFQTIGQFPK